MDEIVPSVSIQFALREAEVAAAFRILWLKRPFVRLLAIIGVGFIPWGLVDSLRGAGQTHGVRILLSGVVIAGIVAIPVLVLPWWQFRKNARMRDEQAHAFSDEGFEVTLSDARSIAKWSFYRQAIVTSDLYFLLHNQRLCNVIPRRAFKSVADEAVFRDLLHRHVRTH